MKNIKRLCLVSIVSLTIWVQGFSHPNFSGIPVTTIANSAGITTTAGKTTKFSSLSATITPYNTFPILSGNAGIGVTSAPQFPLTIPAASDSSFDVAQIGGFNFGRAAHDFNNIMATGGNTNNTNTYVATATVFCGYQQYWGQHIFAVASNQTIGSPVTGVIQALVIKEDGNIGIGISNGATLSAKLSVNGVIRAKELKIEASPWPDYVFNKNYKLRSLSSLESFINQNKHLPELPSAEEVETKGVSVGENQALLLKKIEELTLYVIDQQKQIQELKNLIKKK